MLINNDPILIPTKGCIQAPVISKQDFIRMFVEYADACSTIDKATVEQALTNNKGIIELDSYIFEEMVDDMNAEADYIYATPEEVVNASFDTIVGVHETTTKIPFLGYLCSSDAAIEVFRMVYYDGKEFKIYTPKYGNCWNIDTKMQLFAESGDEADDEDYCNKYGTDASTIQNAPLYQLIDEAAIMQEIEQVFVPGAHLANPVISLPNSNNNTNSTPNSNANPQPAPQKQKSQMDILYDVFSKKRFQMIPPLQQALLSQGAKTYDKTKCFQDLKNKDAFQNDIYNFILQFNNSDSPANKIIECTKISLYIKRFQFYHEGLIL